MSLSSTPSPNRTASEQQSSAGHEDATHTSSPRSFASLYAEYEAMWAEAYPGPITGAERFLLRRAAMASARIEALQRAQQQDPRIAARLDADCPLRPLDDGPDPAFRAQYAARPRRRRRQPGHTSAAPAPAAGATFEDLRTRVSDLLGRFRARDLERACERAVEQRAPGLVLYALYEQRELASLRSTLSTLRLLPRVGGTAAVGPAPEPILAIEPIVQPALGSASGPANERSLPSTSQVNQNEPAPPTSPSRRPRRPSS